MDRTYPVLIGTIPLNPSAIADNRAMPSAPPVDTYQPTMPGDYNNYPTMNNPYSDSSKPGYAPPSNPYPPPTQGFPTPYPPSMPVPGLFASGELFKIRFSDQTSTIITYQ